MTVGERISFFRKKSHLTQEVFANKLNISRSHISKIEHNQDNPSSTLLHQIAMTFNINYDWLASGKGFMDPDEESNDATLSQCIEYITHFSKYRNEKDISTLASILMNLFSAIDSIDELQSVSYTSLKTIFRTVREMCNYLNERLTDIEALIQHGEDYMEYDVSADLSNKYVDKLSQQIKDEIFAIQDFVIDYAEENYGE